jgi:hypothetical protein
MARFDEENSVKRPSFLEWISTIQKPDGEIVSGRTSSYQKIGADLVMT